MTKNNLFALLSSLAIAASPLAAHAAGPVSYGSASLQCTNILSPNSAGTNVCQVVFQPGLQLDPQVGKSFSWTGTNVNIRQISPTQAEVYLLNCNGTTGSITAYDGATIGTSNIVVTGGSACDSMIK